MGKKHQSLKDKMVEGAHPYINKKAFEAFDLVNKSSEEAEQDLSKVERIKRPHEDELKGIPSSSLISELWKRGFRGELSIKYQLGEFTIETNPDLFGVNRPQKQGE